jgi:hypothetical protein
MYEMIHEFSEIIIVSLQDSILIRWGNYCGSAVVMHKIRHLPRNQSVHVCQMTSVNIIE